MLGLPHTKLNYLFIDIGGTEKCLKGKTFIISHLDVLITFRIEL